MAHPNAPPRLLSPGQTCEPQEFLPGRIWLIDYPINYYGVRCNARCTLLQAQDGSLIAHSPAPLTPAVRDFVASLGRVSVILAPGTYHDLYARAWGNACPQEPCSSAPGWSARCPPSHSARSFGTASSTRGLRNWTM